MSNLEELNYAIISDLRDQIETKEQMIKKYKKAISSALNFLACPDRMSETECNEQLAFNVLREVLNVKR